MELRFDGIDLLGQRIDAVPLGRSIGNPTPGGLAFHAADDGLAQIEDVLVGYARLDRHQQDVVLGQILPVDGSDGLENASLQEPAQLTRIDGIAGQPVDTPADDPFGFASLDPGEEFGKDRSCPGRFGGMRLGQFGDHVKTGPLGEVSNHAELIVDALDLAFLRLATLPGVKNISHGLLGRRGGVGGSPNPRPLR
ncbi:hypothetical protein A3A71_03340 [Candidatus Berkelbacteria bacterium RIFCSPLOWO2_01_FULL_50_28]|uniref:Uncharacterized protein n=1 Tax=Candidatus Berkelbacteria bacterium RIFCSPLOWO2_01_FULL_50_28 TaxID=1797471 RepID=A0A1F5ECJ9_9BACT|nr:MAG: hypothetical protein A2807_02905 [Candidatus Berkelbacteria bacterium RIFCSPHIGHO2_01_FULL_50_36]OGD65095.1 MAG: hypothetical protein A3A71_03340 [Candidatus Berkelbacteria bacterium RIFCSPLOWO2_01_FULL_50_28]